MSPETGLQKREEIQVGPDRVEVSGCLRKIRLIRDNRDLPVTIRMQAAKWSAFISSGIHPSTPIELPGKLLGSLDGRLRERELRRWTAERSNIDVRDGMDARFLRETQARLSDLIACIMQTDAKNARTFAGTLGTAITAKISGIGASAGLMSLVSVVGTASTGTAISSLSGAALINAQLAWIGGIVGGGMAAGSVLTLGFSILVGVGVVWLLSRFRVQPRQFEELTEPEQALVAKMSWIIEAIEEDIKTGCKRSWAVQEAFFREHLLPVDQALRGEKELISSKLTTHFQHEFRKKALPNFKRYVLNRYAVEFDRLNLPHLLYKERAAMVVVSTVLWKLWKQNFTFETQEELIVLDALRRSSSGLTDATLQELGSYIEGLDPAQMKGLANNVKGIYHELMFVEEFNSANNATIAELHPRINAPGSDVVIRDVETGEIVREAQLKATESNHYILDHFEKFSDIPVIATTEAAAQIEGVSDSGFSNAELEAEVNDALAKAGDFGPFSEAFESASIGGIAALALYGADSSKVGKSGKEAARRALEGAGIATGTTVVLGYLFG